MPCVISSFYYHLTMVLLPGVYGHISFDISFFAPFGCYITFAPPFWVHVMLMGFRIYYIFAVVCLPLADLSVLCEI